MSSNEFSLNVQTKNDLDGAWTHSCVLDEHRNVIRPTEMCIKEVKILKYFLHLEKDAYITLCEYTENDHQSGDFLRKKIDFKNTNWFMNSALRIRIPAGFYKDKTDLKNYLIHAVGEMNLNRDNISIPEWDVGFSVPLYKHYTDHLFQSEAAAVYRNIDFDCGRFLNFLGRLEFHGENILFAESEYDDERVYGLYMSPEMAAQLECDAENIIGDVTTIFTKHKKISIPSSLTENISVSTDLNQTLLWKFKKEISSVDTTYQNILPEYHLIYPSEINKIRFHIVGLSNPKNIYNFLLHFRDHIL